MKIPRIALPLALAAVALPLASLAQAPDAKQVASAPMAASAPTAVPALVPFTALALDAEGKPLQPQAQINFLIFKDELGGEALWMETQSVEVDPTGHYKVQLGAANSQGLPIELFSTGEARWLEVQIAGQKPQPRILLASVPYALKAGDATTLGGLPVSAFALAGQKPATATNAIAAPDGNPTATDVTTTGGTAGYIPEFSGASTVVDSPLFVNSAGLVGINESAPTATLDVNGTANVRGVLNLPPLAAATDTAGQRSQLLQLTSSAWSSSTSKPVAPTFRLYTVPGGNNTAAPSGALELQYELGSSYTDILSIADNGVITFAPAQTFPGTVKNVTVTSPLTALTLNGVTNLGLNLPTLENTLNGVYARLAAPNTFSQPITFAAGQTFPGALTGVTVTAPLTASTNSGVSTVGLNINSLENTLNTIYPTLEAPNNFEAITTFERGLVSSSASNIFPAVAGYGTSGDTGVEGSTDTGYGVYGTASGNGNAGYFSNGSLSHSTLYATNSASTSGGGYPNAITGATVGSGTIAITGAASGTNSTGVYGFTSAVGSTGVAGYAGGTSNSSFGNTIGVFGNAEAGTGVLGVRTSTSNTYASAIAVDYAAGIWGDTNGGPGAGSGVTGTADNTEAGFFQNNGAQTTVLVANVGSGPTGSFANDSATSATLYVTNMDSAPTGPYKTLMATSPGGTCGIGGSGDLSCTGQLKSLVSTGGGSRKLETYAMQSPENWMEDFGSGVLERGVALVKIDPAFAETVAGDASYHVFITPNGDSKGLYVIRKTATTFEVRESGGGVSSLTFDYRIVAKRRGYESQRLTDVTEGFNAAIKDSDLHRKSAISPLPGTDGVHHDTLPRPVVVPSVPPVPAHFSR